VHAVINPQFAIRKFEIPMVILGINAYHGDASAALVIDGKLVAAVEEERFNRFKHCAGFPAESIRYCMHAAGIGLDKVDHIGISRDPSAHLHKKILHAASRMGRTAVGLGAGAAKNGEKSGGIIRMLTDRLSNAAKVRDLQQELSASLGVCTDNLGARFHN